MPESMDPVIPAAHRPHCEDVAFDLDAALSAVCSLRTEIPEDAFTAPMLGTERAGHGVLIREDGLILTIGYLVIEARTVWLVDGHGKASTGHVVGYDRATGFGLVQALDSLDSPVMNLGHSAGLRGGDEVIVAGHGGPEHAIRARVISRHEFAGYWEYVLDEAIFTAPPHPFWGGTALIGGDGTLLGIGSLFVQEVPPGEEPFDGNMIVPIDLLNPILDDLVNLGRTREPPRPWLGIYMAEAEGSLVVAGVAEGGPAQRADVRIGDVVVAVGDTPVPTLAALFRAIWALGEAGVEVPLAVLRDDDPLQLRVRSARRADFLKPPRVH